MIGGVDHVIHNYVASTTLEDRPWDRGFVSKFVFESSNERVSYLVLG